MITFRRAATADAPLLSELGRGTFIEAFGHLYRPEDLEAFLEGSHSVSAYQRILEDDHNIALLAQSPNRAIGYGIAGRCKLPVERLEPRAGEIKRLYVRAETQGQQLGTQLLDRLIDELERREYDPLYVGVWSENFGAQRLYVRYGFSKIGEYDFPVGQQIDREFILRRPPQHAAAPRDR